MAIQLIVPIQKYWTILKKDFIQFIQEFHTEGKLSKGMAATFITLIPKVSSPDRIEQYRPISLVTSGYKVLAKLLATRLKQVLPKLISNSQTAFLKGRNILDGVLIANELIHSAKKSKRPGILLKVDFSKAFDTVHWPYLFAMKKNFGFSEVWIKWITECVTSTYAAVLVNGSSSGEFKIRRGIRQGDPLSPFLFLIAAEGLHLMLTKAVDLGKLTGLRCGQTLVTHLQYADDTLLFAEGTQSNAFMIKAVLRLFEMVSGLSINFTKSKIYGLNCHREQLGDFARIMQCSSSTIPFTYLGLQIGANPRRCITWEPVAETIRKRVTSWSTRFLSFAGKITLLKSVLSSLPIYYLSLYKAPQKVIKKIEKIMANFLWTPKLNRTRAIHWISWRNMGKQKKDGGLGIRDLQSMNTALMAKWLWRLRTEPTSLWNQVIRFKYFQDQDHLSDWRLITLPGDISQIWQDIWRISKAKWFNRRICLIVNGGDKALFWKHDWTGDGLMALQYAQLYRLSLQKHSTVAELFQHQQAGSNWHLQFARSLRDRELILFTELSQQLDKTQIPRQGNDQWQWTGDPSGIYSVSSAYLIIASLQGCTETQPQLAKVWNNFSPQRIQAFSWRLLQDRLPTMTNLIRRGMTLNQNEMRCVFCGSTEESAAHLFLQCRDAWELWCEVYKWFGLLYVGHNNLQQHFTQHMGLIKGKQGIGLWKGLWQAVTWHVWKERNDIRWDAATDNMQVLDRLKLSLWQWLKASQKTVTGATISTWKKHPELCSSFTFWNPRRE